MDFLDENRETKVAVIGLGNMGGIIVRHWIGHGLFRAGNIWVSGHDATKMEPVLEMGARQATDNLQAAQEADIILLSVKPKHLMQVCQEIGGACEGKCVVSIAAGVPLAAISRHMPQARVIRAMPNVACENSEGVIGVSSNPQDKPDAYGCALALFGQMGMVVWVPENEMAALTAIGGSGPAFVFKFVETLIEAAVLEGLESEGARRMAIQMVKGAAIRMEPSHLSGDELVSQIATPGGGTAEGLTICRELEVWSGLTKALRATAQRYVRMGLEAEQESGIRTVTALEKAVNRRNAADRGGTGTVLPKIRQTGRMR